MIHDLVVSGRLVDPLEGDYEAEIGIKDGIINKISQKPLEGRRISLPESSLVFPGFIDAHVHLRQDASGTWNYKEDFVTGSMAAANGGVTAVADMPNNPLPATTPERIMEKLSLSKKSLIDILFYGCVSGNLEKLKAMAKLVCGYKIYAEETTGIEPIDLETIEKAVKILSDTEKPVVFHSGDMLKQILDICKDYSARIHIAHVSKKSEIELIEKYKKKMQLTCEAAPHHIFPLEKEKLGILSKVNPPLMPESDRKAVLEALRDGTIDILATDHAPHTREDKQKGAAGMPELDTYGPFAAWLIKNNLSLKRTAQVTSGNPAGILNLSKAGSLQEGFAANLAIIDTAGFIKIKDKALYTKCAWSPYEGCEFPGRVTHTIYNGKIIMHNGRLA